uniref:Apple domain-containing protein n=1 Tax=Strongyloides stercoralis TaxID=6248 RepID=A0A0K0DX88_STRER
MYNKDFLDKGNSSVSGFSSTSIYNNYEYNIRTSNNTSLNDLVKHNAILQHMPMFDNQSNVKNIFVTQLPTTITIKKAFIKRIRKKISKDEVKELKIFNNNTKKQDNISKLPEEEKKINFSALLNESLSNMGYLKRYDYKSHEIRKLQPHIKKSNNNDVQRLGVYFNEASIPSLINVDNDITQYEDINKITSTTMKATTFSENIIEEYLKKKENLNLNKEISNYAVESSSNLPFTVTETFEKEFDLFTSKEDLSKEDIEIKNNSVLTTTRTILSPLKDDSLMKTTINNKLLMVKPTKESERIKLTKAEDDRNLNKILTYFRVPQQHLTFITKSSINGIEENSVKKVISSNKNIITLPNILFPSLNKSNIINNKIQRIENTYETTFINDNHITNNHKNYAFGSLIQPILEENYLYTNNKESTQKPYIFDIPAPIQLPTSKILSLYPSNIINDIKIKEKVVLLKKLQSNKKMINGRNLLSYYPKNLYSINTNNNEKRKKENFSPIQFGSVLIEKEKPSGIKNSYNDKSYHSKIVLKCFDIKEDIYISKLKSKERRINVSEKECAMFCGSHSECSFITFYKKLNLCDLYVVKENKKFKKNVVFDNEKKLIQKYGIPFSGVNLLLPLKNDGGVGKCIKKIYDDEKNLINEDGFVINSEELQFMNNNIDENKTKKKTLGSTMFVVHSEDKPLSEKLLENWNNTINEDKLFESTKEVLLHDNDAFYKLSSSYTSCPNGKKIYYIKNEGHQLKENQSKSIIKRCNLIECQRACSENVSLKGFNTICSSFSYNFIKKECYLYEHGSDFENNNHLIKNESFNHYESICLNESLVKKCEIINKYPIRKNQKLLIGYAIDSFKFSNIQQCIGKCLTNEDCQSITYFHDNEEDSCILNSEYSITDNNSFIEVQNPNTVDFISFSNCQKNFPKNKMGVI